MTAEWQLIATAPRDHERVVFVIWPDTEPDKWIGAAVSWKKHRWWPNHGWWADEHGRKVDPTHWLPQPAKHPEWIKS